MQHYRSNGESFGHRILYAMRYSLFFQLTINYCDLFLTTSARRHLLKKYYFFDCNCDACADLERVCFLWRNISANLDGSITILPHGEAFELFWLVICNCRSMVSVVKTSCCCWLTISINLGSHVMLRSLRIRFAKPIFSAVRGKKSILISLQVEKECSLRCSRCSDGYCPLSLDKNWSGLKCKICDEYSTLDINEARKLIEAINVSVINQGPMVFQSFGTAML